MNFNNAMPCVFNLLVNTVLRTMYNIEMEH